MKQSNNNKDGVKGIQRQHHRHPKATSPALEGNIQIKRINHKKERR
jgi:hypothetical protein